MPIRSYGDSPDLPAKLRLGQSLHIVRARHDQPVNQLIPVLREITNAVAPTPSLTTWRSRRAAQQAQWTAERATTDLYGAFEELKEAGTSTGCGKAARPALPSAPSARSTCAGWSTWTSFASLTRHGLRVEWDGDLDTRIGLGNAQWYHQV